MGIDRNLVISAISNLSTAYNLVNINLAHVILENQYCGGDNCKSMVTMASTACLAGAIMGQLSFGYIGDCLGRGPALQLTMLLSILGALVSACAVPINSSDQSTIFTFLTVTRFFLGVGVGGVYPLAATISAESACNEKRGRNVSLVFSMQGIGTLLVPIVGMVLLKIFGTPSQRTTFPGISWRLILGLGALPGILLAPFKTNQVAPQSPTSPQVALREEEQPLTLMQALATSAYWPKLLGCAGGWFIFDITFYGNTLFAPTVLKELFHGPKQTPVNGDNLKDNLCYQLAILALIGLPGYYISVFFMDKLGRKVVQLQGFIMMGVTYGILGIWMTQLESQNVLLIVIYGLTYFFSNFGPNSTTFILPSESFPYEVRTSLNGFCAAMGKAGATLGSAVFKPMVNTYGSGFVFGLCAGCALVGALLTVLFIEDKRGQEMEASPRNSLTGRQISLCRGQDTA
eukprot:gnl/MRDRNA2_/MRDRNA2_17049_c0_seq1.p1 gnl/MRDRNA2_/MRDRNA2_17049_c0~~gnl/MRDRNA2_/MRDRNA2_17049_c0_seq1.p1  ORF type:complete len:459 (+),score=53.96 gnl/MRDRNA2_/MRDRNA2_17049_c0_seq1:100-1476(+)